MFDPSSPKNGVDLLGTFVIAGLYSVIIYIIISGIIWVIGLLLSI